MAVSKTQNERPAINALIDLANGLENSVNGQAIQISNLHGALTSEITSRTNADTLLGNQIQAESLARESADDALGNAVDAEETAREEAVSEILGILGTEFTEYNTVSDFASDVTEDIDELQTFKSMIQSTLKFGVSTEATVQGNNYYDGTVTYTTPFPTQSNSFVIPAFLSGVEQSDLEVTISECDHEGFSYTVINRDTTAKTFVIGYIAWGQAIS